MSTGAMASRSPKSSRPTARSPGSSGGADVRLYPAAADPAADRRRHGVGQPVAVEARPDGRADRRRAKAGPPDRTGRRAAARPRIEACGRRSEEHTSELQSLMPTTYAVFCLKKKKKNKQ